MWPENLPNKPSAEKTFCWLLHAFFMNVDTIAPRWKDIARVVDLTAGSLYHHFPEGKQEILLAVLNLGLDKICDEIQVVLDSDLSPEAKLRRAVELHITSVTDNVSIGAAMVFEIRTMLDIEEVREAYVLRRDRFESLFRAMVQEGV